MSGRHAAPSPDAPATPEGAGESVPAALLRVVAGDPTTDELAAVTALLAAVEAGRAETVAATTSRPATSAWTRSARAPRPAIVAGAGHWRGFAG